MYDVIVVGGGIAGLVAAHVLQEAGLNLLVLESEPYPGGRIRTVSYGDNYAEAGASVVTAGEEHTLTLLNKFGIDHLISLGQHGVELFLNRRVLQLTRMDGRIQEFRDLRSLLKFFVAGKDSLLPFPGPSLYQGYRRALLEIDKQARRIQFPYQPNASAQWDAESFATFLDRFHPGLRHYFDIQLKVTAGELSENISLFWGLVTFHWNVDERFYWISGGTGMLPQALAKELGVRLQLGATVHSVSDLDPIGTVCVRYSWDGDDHMVHSTSVIIATPPHATMQFVDGLSAKKRLALESVRFGSYIVVHLVCRRRFWEEKIRTGYLNCSGVVFADLLDGTKGQPGVQGILTCFLAGSEAKDLLDSSDEVIFQAIDRDLEVVFPRTREEILKRHIFRWPYGIPYFPPNYSGVLRELRRPQENMFFAGDYTQGAGINDAVVSGQIAAQAVIDFLNYN